MNKLLNRYLSTLFVLLWTANSHAAIEQEIDVDIAEQTLSLKVISSDAESSNKIIIWVAPGFGTHQRAMDVSKKIADTGTEVWHVDMAESLFMPKSTNTMRKLSGKYLAGLIEYAYQKTGKNILLLTRSYGAIPVLRALRHWQVMRKKTQPYYLQGAVLFSPELYATVPELGKEPVFTNIIDASNMPLMIYQGEKRSNRWQLEKLLQRLQKVNESVYYNILKGVNGIFYSKDNSPNTLKQLQLIPKKIMQSFVLLEKTPKPEKAASLVSDKEITPGALDIKLKKFTSSWLPHSIDLYDVKDSRYTKTNYKGQVTVVNFWASWCPPCVKEIPSLNNLRKIMQGEKFELVSVNYGEHKQTVQDFMKKVDVDFPVLLDTSGEYSAKWKVLVFPSTFIIGPDGKIKYGVNAAIHWDDKNVVKQLKALLNDK